MKEHPIIFNAEMVRAILEGRKTQTRRVMKPQPSPVADWAHGNPELVSCGFDGTNGYASYTGGAFKRFRCPYGTPGDQLWVRETWAILDDMPDSRDIVYRADYPGEKSPEGRWRSPIHMFRWASRITLEVVSVQVERVQDLSTRDCVAEGISQMSNPTPKYPQGTVIRKDSLRRIFSEVWDSINAKRGEKKWLVEPWDLWLWGRDEHDDPESIALDIRDPGAIQWRDPEELGPDYEFHFFRDSQPPNDGYYEVVWEKGSLVEYVYLRRADPVEGEDFVKYDYSWSSNPWVWVVEFRQVK